MARRKNRFGLEQLKKFAERHYLMTDGRYTKISVVYQFAYNMENGVIVELGTGCGLSTVALCYGTNYGGYSLPVHTVDHFVSFKGWSGEEYVPENKYTAMERFEKAGIDPIMHEDDFEDAAQEWKGGEISLLFWDAGSYLMESHIAAWMNHVAIGGIILLHDTPDMRLGTKRVVDMLYKEGKYSDAQYPGNGFTSILKVC